MLVTQALANRNRIIWVFQPQFTPVSDLNAKADRMTEVGDVSLWRISHSHETLHSRATRPSLCRPKGPSIICKLISLSIKGWHESNLKRNLWRLVRAQGLLTRAMEAISLDFYKIVVQCVRVWQLPTVLKSTEESLRPPRRSSQVRRVSNAEM